MNYKHKPILALITGWIQSPELLAEHPEVCKRELSKLLTSQNTGYKDINGKDIFGGMEVSIHANPHHGKYKVAFGEYSHKKLSKNDRQKTHCGWYLHRGKIQVSLAHVMRQPTGYGSSKHTLEIIKSSTDEQPTE